MSPPVISTPLRAMSFCSCCGNLLPEHEPRQSWPLIALRPPLLPIRWFVFATEKSKKLSDIEMPRLILFYQLLIRPLVREPMRSVLTLLAVALGAAVFLAIDLAGNAATGSFRSSVETLAGDNDLEGVAGGGVPETAVVSLAQLPYELRGSPRVEDFAVLSDSKQTLPLIGVDLIAEGERYLQKTTSGTSKPEQSDAERLHDPDS